MLVSLVFTACRRIVAVKQLGKKGVSAHSKDRKMEQE